MLELIVLILSVLIQLAGMYFAGCIRAWFLVPAMLIQTAFGLMALRRLSALYLHLHPVESPHWLIFVDHGALPLIVSCLLVIGLGMISLEVREAFVERCKKSRVGIKKD